MNSIYNIISTKNLFQSPLANTLRDQALGITELFLNISKQLVSSEEQRKILDLSLDIIDIYYVTKIPSKTVKIKEAISQLKCKVEKNEHSAVDIMQSAGKPLFNTVLLLRTSIKITLALGKRNLIPLYTQLKPISIHLAFTLSFLAFFNSFLNISHLRNENNVLKKEADVNSFYKKHVPDLAIQIRNAQILIDRKLKVEYVNLVSTTLMTTCGILTLTGLGPPLIPLALKGGAMTIEAGVAYYNSYRLNEGLVSSPKSDKCTRGDSVKKKGR